MKPVTMIAGFFKSIRNRIAKWAEDRQWAEVFADELDKFAPEDQPWIKPILRNQMVYGRSAYPGNTVNHDQERMLFSAAANASRSLLQLQDIIGIQPLSGPSGLIYHMHILNPSPSGISLVVEKEVVQVRSSRLSSRVELQPENTNASAAVFDLVSAVGESVGQELVNHALADVSGLARKNTTKLARDPSLSNEEFAVRLVLVIHRVANQIARTTRRGVGNFVVVSPAIAEVLCALSPNQFSPADFPSVTGYHDLEFVGTLTGTIRVYRAPLFVTSSPSELVIVGYKGHSHIDTGYIYAPYVLVMNSGVVIDPNTFAPVLGLMTRGGSYAHKSESGQGSDYYSAIEIEPVAQGVDQPELVVDNSQ